MNFNLNAVKKSLRMLGIDIDQSVQMAVPALAQFLDNRLQTITTEPGQTKGFIIIADAHGDYHLIATLFHQDANQHLDMISHEKLEDLMSNLINSVQHA